MWVGAADFLGLAEGLLKFEVKKFSENKGILIRNLLKRLDLDGSCSKIV